MSKFKRALIIFYVLCCMAEICLLLLRAAELISWPWVWVNTPLWVGMGGFMFLGLYYLFTWDPGEGSTEDLIQKGASTPAEDKQAAAALEAMAVRQIHLQLDHFDEVILIVRAGDIISAQSGARGGPQLDLVFMQVRKILQSSYNIKPLKFPPNGK